MIKLVPAAQDFSVCLRCQYRLSIRQETRPGRRRRTTYPQQLRRFTSRASLQQEPSSAHDGATNDPNLGRAPIRYLSEGLHSYQNYRQGNGPPTKDSLGLNVLGEPAEVLILRDRERRFQLDSAMAKVRASGPDKSPVPEPISSSEMLEKMDAERGIIDIDEVCKNIESVKASWMATLEGSVTGKAYKDLASRLQSGFTKQQLGAYLDRERKVPAADVFDLNVEFSNNVYARSSWWPVGHVTGEKCRAPRIVDSTPEDFSEKDDFGKESRREVTKKTLVKKILKRCWNINIGHQESSSGELDIRLQPLHQKLILNHKRGILKQLAKTYDAKVEAWRQAPIIRITSDYDSCLDVFKILMHTLENIRASTIDLDIDSMSYRGSGRPGRNLDDAMFRQIEKYTNTLVESQDVSRKALLVYYLGPDDADLLEMQRLTHQILRPASTQTSKLAWSNGDESSDTCPVPVIVGSKLPMLDRNQEWSRWCSPHTRGQATEQQANDRSPSSSSLASPAAQAVPGKLAFETVKSFFGTPDNASYKPCRTNTPYWKSEIEYHDSAKFGQVLFHTNWASSLANVLRSPQKQRRAGTITKAINNRSVGFRSSRQPREFVPLVPGLVHSLESLGALDKSEEFIRIRLSPSPKNMSLPVPVKALPDLEITISLAEKNETNSIKDVRLVIRKEKDFLQPQRIVDLRFIREQRVYANDNNIDPQILSFVQNSHFNISGTEHLKTPLGLSVSIPTLAIQPHKDYPANYDTLLVDYTSLALEHRSSLTMSYQEPDSWPTLTCTNIEAGPIGGRRDELSLHNVRFTSNPLLPTDPNPSSPITIDTKPLSDDDHTSILFQKTAAVIKSIEQSSRNKRDKSSLRMPKLQVKRWRRKMTNRVRKVGVLEVRRQEVGKDDASTEKDTSASEHVLPVDENIGGDINDQSVRPVESEGERVSERGS